MAIVDPFVIVVIVTTLIFHIILIICFYKCHSCCKAIDKCSGRKLQSTQEDVDTSPRPYDAIEVASRRIPQPSHSRSNNRSTQIVTSTNIASNYNINNNQQRTNNGRNYLTLSTMMITPSSNRINNNNNTIYTIENEQSTTAENINRALDALRIPERNQTRQEINSNPPAFRTLFSRTNNNEYLPGAAPPMCMPTAIDHKPIEINNKINNSDDDLPSYDDVLRLQKY